MIVKHNISLQQLSWVKSNKQAFDADGFLVPNVYYPESIEELKTLTLELLKNKQKFLVLGYSSNTLFLPSYRINNIIVTKKLCSWKETSNTIICECGLAVTKLAKAMVKKGYEGFEGLTDLPGTIAAAVYGNCGCRNCSVNALLSKITFFNIRDGKIYDILPTELNLSYRCSVIKRGELSGVILTVELVKKVGNVGRLKALAEENHQIRLKHQPTGVNNLGTTFIGGHKKTFKGKIFTLVEYIIRLFLKDTRKSYPILLMIMGKRKYVPYIYYWNRYMFNDLKLEIEVRA